MEHYKKKQSRLFDTAVLPNEIKVSGSSKAHDLCTKAVHKLKVRCVAAATNLVPISKAIGIYTVWLINH